MSINRLYHTWFQKIRQLRPDERVTRVRTLVWLMIGIYQSRSVHLSRIAGKIPGRALLLSTTRRLSRWLDNPAVRVREWYAPIAKEVLASMAASTGEVRLIADASCVGPGHQLLILSLAFRRRAIPLTWTWIRPCRPAGPRALLSRQVLCDRPGPAQTASYHRPCPQLRLRKHTRSRPGPRLWGLK